MPNSFAVLNLSHLLPFRVPIQRTQLTDSLHAHTFQDQLSATVSCSLLRLKAGIGHFWTPDLRGSQGIGEGAGVVWDESLVAAAHCLPLCTQEQIWRRLGGGSGMAGGNSAEEIRKEFAWLIASRSK